MTQDEKATLASILKDNNFTHEEARAAMVDLFERGTDPSRGWISRLLANLRSGKYAEMVTPEVRQWVEAILNDTADGSGASTQPAPAAVNVQNTEVYSAWVPESSNADWPTYQFVGTEESEPEAIAELAEPEMEGNFVIVGDVHCPTTEWSLVDLVAQIGDYWLPKGNRRLIIAGDFFNMNSQAKFKKRLPQAKLETELQYGEKVLNFWLEHFDEAFMIIGNHDSWFFENFGGDFSTARFKRMITKYPSRLQISPYSGVKIRSGDHWWYVPHQKEYRKNKLSVANDMAMLEHMNVIATHQHYSSTGRDYANRYTIVDIGGLHKVSRMGYPFEAPNCKPKMCQGFVMLKDGCAHLITPYPTMTDLSLYLPDNAQERAA